MFFSLFLPIFHPKTGFFGLKTPKKTDYSALRRRYERLLVTIAPLLDESAENASFSAEND
jgi:hypothetical protein